MPQVRAGDIRQLTVGGRELDPGAEGDVNIDLGGLTNETSQTGNGQTHRKQTRKNAGFSDCPVSIDGPRQDLEYLQAIANAGADVPTTMTMAGGEVYSGALCVEGDFGKSTANGTATLEMRGSRFEQI